MGLITSIRCFMHLLLLLSIFYITNAEITDNDVFGDLDIITDPTRQVPTGEYKYSVPVSTDEYKHTVQSDPVQVRTHPNLDVLKVLIQDGKQPFFKLRLRKSKQLVANHNLPVWGAQCGEIHESKTKVTGKILKHFIMYQDSRHDAAIVYVTNKELIYGNVGIKYYIHDVPLELLLNKTVLQVGGPYVQRNPNIGHQDITTEPAVDTGKPADERAANEIPPLESNPKHKENGHAVSPEVKSEEFYVETLLFVTHDIVERIKRSHPDDYLFHILLHYAVYFNSMDMLLAKLPTHFRVYVNLAGIIFEEDPDVFSSVIKSSILDYGERNESLVLEGFARLFSNYYLLDPNFVLPANSFDLVFISTSRDLEYEEVKVLGQSFGGVDIYYMRQTRTQPMIGIPKSVVSDSDVFTSFAVGAHEIGNVFAYHNPEEEHCIEESDAQLPVCDHCLEWSPDTVEGIKKFMSGNRNRCWLLNYPRSLHPSDVPVLGLSPSEQCQCYGYAAFGKKNDMARKHVSYNACVRALSCVKVENRNQMVEFTILPFDGTPCQRGGGKVCWREKCVEVHHEKKLQTQNMYGWKSYAQ